MRARTLTVFASVAALTLAFTPSCSSAPPPDPCAGIAVDDFKELMIVDDSVVSDARTKNASDGPWSFRHVIESLAPPNMDPGEFVRKWFLEWVTTTTFNGYKLYTADETATSRLDTMNSEVLCPWMQRTAGNNCDVDCTNCDTNPPKLDLAQAPFRPIAIVNRMDLRGQPDLGVSGESRIIFNMVAGAGDDSTANPMPLTMIFEYGLPTTSSTQDWARAWHALGAYPTMDDSFKTALATFTERWIGGGAVPEKQNASALSQVRTNESALFWVWQERQFELGTDGSLHVAGLRNTPPDALNETNLVGTYILDNSQVILSQDYAMPKSLVGGSSSAQLFSWAFPNVTDETLRRTFSINTCNGCHTQEERVDTAFHVSPFRDGPARLSTFVYNKLDRSKDQLTIREQSLRDALCGK